MTEWIILGMALVALVFVLFDWLGRDVEHADDERFK